MIRCKKGSHDSCQFLTNFNNNTTISKNSYFKKLENYRQNDKKKYSIVIDAFGGHAGSINKDTTGGRAKIQITIPLLALLKDSVKYGKNLN